MIDRSFRRAGRSFPARQLLAHLMQEALRSLLSMRASIDARGSRKTSRCPAAIEMQTLTRKRTHIRTKKATVQ